VCLQVFCSISLEQLEQKILCISQVTSSCNCNKCEFNGDSFIGDGKTEKTTVADPACFFSCSMLLPPYIYDWSCGQLCCGICWLLKKCHFTSLIVGCVQLAERWLFSEVHTILFWICLLCYISHLQRKDIAWGYSSKEVF
jgi:hypothetical protein